MDTLPAPRCSPMAALLLPRPSRTNGGNPGSSQTGCCADSQALGFLPRLQMTQEHLLWRTRWSVLTRTGHALDICAFCVLHVSTGSHVPRREGSEL